VNTWLFLLALAAMILAPNNPVGLLLLFVVACLKVWRTSDAVEDSDHPGGDCDLQSDCGPVFESGDLT
jgi:hypothetical protein